MFICGSKLDQGITGNHEPWRNQFESGRASFFLDFVASGWCGRTVYINVGDKLHIRYLT